MPRVFVFEREDLPLQPVQPFTDRIDFGSGRQIQSPRPRLGELPSADLRLRLPIVYVVGRAPA